MSGYTAPEEALAAARANPDQFDLVVTDYNMPGMSGLDVARNTERDSRRSAGNTDFGLHHRGTAAGSARGRIARTYFQGRGGGRSVRSGCALRQRAGREQGFFLIRFAPDSAVRECRLLLA